MELNKHLQSAPSLGRRQVIGFGELKARFVSSLQVGEGSVSTLPRIEFLRSWRLGVFKPD
jgi:hypothetical protein